MVRPRICNPVIPSTGGAGSGFALQCGEVVWRNRLFILRTGEGRKTSLSANFAQDTAAAGALGASDSMDLPRKCLKQNKSSSEC